MIDYSFHQVLGTWLPIILYWSYAAILTLVWQMFPSQRIRKLEEPEKNVVSRSVIIKGVLLQQSIQAIVATLLYVLTSHASATDSSSCSSFSSGNNLIIATVQIAIAMATMDLWQYLVHRAMHRVPFLYKHIHSQHHRLVVPYAYGAMYQHPLEGLLADTMGGAISFIVSGMSPKTSIYFFSLATLKGVHDHSGLLWKWHPFHFLFENNAVYHDFHHQLSGMKFNYSQPFFTFWDRCFGTYRMP